MSTKNSDMYEEFGVEGETKLSIHKSTKKLVMVDCRRAFLRDHPEFEGKNITQNHMVRQLAEFYLREE